MPGRRFHLLCIASLLSVMLAGARVAPAATPEANDPWPGLVQDIFNNRPMNDGSDVIGVEMPTRAEDAAIVPVTLRTKLAPGDSFSTSGRKYPKLSTPRRCRVLANDSVIICCCCDHTNHLSATIHRSAPE